MHILLSPNAFKNSLPADEAAEAVKCGLALSEQAFTIVSCPVGDGGDGTGKLLIQHLNADKIVAETVDPLFRKIIANFGFMREEKTAIIELADASGIRLLQPSEYNPLLANTYGTGLLIKKALDIEAKKIILCIGGSATVDGGTGMLQALGIRFLDNEKNEIKDLPKGLERLADMDITGLDERIAQTEIIILCDVKNKLLGKEGAAAVFGPQKGATDSDIVFLEKGLSVFNKLTAAKTGINMSNLAHSGAAGGAAAALCAFCNAKAVDGITTFLDLIEYDKYLEKADAVITGEGSLDRQTLQGKAPFGVAAAAKKLNKKVIGIAGQIPEKDKPLLSSVFDEMININPPGTPIEIAIRDTKKNLINTGKLLANLIF